MFSVDVSPGGAPCAWALVRESVRAQIKGATTVGLDLHHRLPWQEAGAVVQARSELLVCIANALKVRTGRTGRTRATPWCSCIATGVCRRAAWTTRPP